jgi:large subunit ribosomal protein L23
MDSTHVLQAPVVTEKSSGQQAQRKYTFYVHLKANKVEVAKAISEAYGVKVAKVNLIPVRKKERRVGRSRVITKRPTRKKAIVTVEPKDVIDVNKFIKSK